MKKIFLIYLTYSLLFIICTSIYGWSVPMSASLYSFWYCSACIVIYPISFVMFIMPYYFGWKAFKKATAFVVSKPAPDSQLSMRRQPSSEWKFSERF